MAFLRSYQELTEEGAVDNAPVVEADRRQRLWHRICYSVPRRRASGAVLLIVAGLVCCGVLAAVPRVSSRGHTVNRQHSQMQQTGMVETALRARAGGPSDGKGTVFFSTLTEKKSSSSTEMQELEETSAPQIQKAEAKAAVQGLPKVDAQSVNRPMKRDGAAELLKPGGSAALSLRVTPEHPLAPSNPSTSGRPVADHQQHFHCPAHYPKPYCPGEWPTEYIPEGSFPDGFIWGAGTASYQVEGGYRDDGRGASIWDTFTGANTVGMPGGNCSYCCKKAPCKIQTKMLLSMDERGATGNVACDHYHMWKSDIALMKSMGLKHYRFSIAWPRIFPTGHAAGGINAKGINFYNRLIDGLLEAGITPHVTLYHWDLPQGLLDPPRWQGWWSRDAITGQPNNQILPEWLAYADACFHAFGDRVKTWFTFNEPWTFIYTGVTPTMYSNHTVDPYIAAHNVLNAHAAAVELYRRKYQKQQRGLIGIINNCDWREPKTVSQADVQAAERTLEFFLGWFADPIYSGRADYPASMRKILGDRLPVFTAEQRRLLNGSADFFGLNNYGTAWALNESNGGNMEWDPQAVKLSEHGFPHAQSDWLYGAGWGLRKLLNWIDRRYQRPKIYITEGGWSIKAYTAKEAEDDRARIQYYANYTTEVRKAISLDGVNVGAYFAWSLLDNFEWGKGYKERFGITFTDYAFGYDPNAPANITSQPTAGTQTRQRKESSCWLEKVWRNNSLVGTHPMEYGGCPTPVVFNSRYKDSQNVGCERRISVDVTGKLGSIMGTQARSGKTCDGATDISVGPTHAKIFGGTIVADMTALGGESALAGYWNMEDGGIEWADGSTWYAIPDKVLFRQLH